MALDVKPGFGLELIEKQTISILFASLNAEIAVQASVWASTDQAFATNLSRPYFPIELEPVNSSNFYPGHTPSLIEAPINKYPNVSVMAYSAQPTGEQIDQVSSWNDKLYVELMVKSDTSEEECNSRVKRTASAVANVLLREPSLNGTILNLQNPPSIDIGEVFVRREDGQTGVKWFWQGARLEFMFTRYSTYS